MGIYLGIDPGVNGGLAWLGLGALPLLEAMPRTDRDVLELLRAHRPTFAVLEDLHPRPTRWIDKETGEPRSSILRSTGVLMLSCGALRMALVACDIPFETLRPQAWQKLLGLAPKAGKPGLKRKAQELFPMAKITNKTADALLLAELARRFSRTRMQMI